MLESMTFVSQCHSLSTLVWDIPFELPTPFTLPTLTYLGCCWACNTQGGILPNLQTPVLLGVSNDPGGDDATPPLPSWSSLTMSAVVGAARCCDGFGIVLCLNPGIVEKLMLILDRSFPY